MDKQLSSIQNEEDDCDLIPLLKVEPESLVQTSIVPDLQGTDAGEEMTSPMIMVDPSLVTGGSIETTSTTVPINLILQDGSVFQLNAVTNGDMDLQTLQNLVSAQLLSQPSVESEIMNLNGLGQPIVDGLSHDAANILTTSHTAQENVFPNVTFVSNGLLPASSKAHLHGIKVEVPIHNVNHVLPELKAIETLQNYTIVQKPEQVTHFRTEKKNRGGWPKGKKRKAEKIVNSPKPPTTAYGFFTQTRRISLREELPNLTFAEMVKSMGNEWSCLPNEEKQKYLDRASEDKKRYMRDLEVYQQSDEYQEFVRTNKTKGKDGSSFDTLSRLAQKNDDDVLYCDVCDFYFTNQHNRKEHLMGQRHISNVSKLYEADLVKKRKQQEQTGILSGLATPHITVEIEQIKHHVSGPGITCDGGPTDPDEFVTAFIHKNQDREIELIHLRGRVQNLQTENTELRLKCEQLKEMEMNFNNEITTLKTYGAALTAQVDALHMVPNLFSEIMLFKL